MALTPDRWEHLPLIPNCVPLVKVEVIVWLDGPGDQFGVGWTVTDGITGEWLGAEVTPVNRPLRDVSLAGSLAWADAHRLARTFVSPF